MAVEPGGAMVLVEQDVKDAPAVARPHDAPARPLDPVLEIDPGLEVAYPDGVELGAALVEAPGDIAVVRRMMGPAEAEERPLACFGIAVDQDRFSTALARRARQHRLLTA